MPGIDVGDIIHIRVHGTLLGQQIITGWHYQCVTASTQADTVTACTTLAGSWKAGAVSPFLSFLACCPENYNADVVYAQKISPVRYRAGFNNVNLPGTDPNPTNSTNQASFVEKSTVLAARGETGGWHIPGLTEPNLENGLVSNAFLTKMSTFGSKCLNTFLDIADGTLELYPVMWHRWKGVPFPVRPPLQLSVTIPQRTARVMRRRTIGVGK